MRIDQFDDEMQKDLAWRKQEISQLYLILIGADTKEVVMKSMILLLYAHWEGFIKRSSKLYLRYVNEKKVKVKDLTINFHAIRLKAYAQECIQHDSKNLAQELQFLNAQHKAEDKPFKCKIDVENDLDEDIINTGHNLSSKVLAAIIDIVGMHYSDAMKTRANYLDAVFLYNRNSIGHAGKMASLHENSTEITLDEVVRLKEFVLILLDYYSELLCDYAHEEYFLLKNAESRIEYEAQKETELKRKLDSIGKNK